MASVFAFGFVLAFAASAAAQPASNTVEQNAYQRAVWEHKRLRLTTGVLRSETIALGVASACLREGRAMFAASPTGANVLETHDREALRSLLTRFAAKVVVRYRSLQK